MRYLIYGEENYSDSGVEQQIVREYLFRYLISWGQPKPDNNCVVIVPQEQTFIYDTVEQWCNEYDTAFVSATSSDRLLIKTYRPEVLISFGQGKQVNEMIRLAKNAGLRTIEIRVGEVADQDTGEPDE